MVCAELRGPKITNAPITKTSRTQAFAISIPNLLKVVGNFACELIKLRRLWERLAHHPGPRALGYR